MSASSANPKSPTTGAGAGAGAGTDPRPVTTPSGARTQPQIPHLYPIPHHAFHVYHPTSLRPHLNPNPNPNSNPFPAARGMPYPVASSGRGFVTHSLRPLDAGFPPRSAPVGIAYRPPPGSHLDPALAHLHQLPLHGHQYAYPLRVVRHGAVDPYSPGSRQHPVPGAGREAAVGCFPPKAAPSPSHVQNSNGSRSSSDGSREDKLVTISGRKVRIVEGSSLYAFCRSWVRNGQPEDCQVCAICAR